VVAVLVSAEGVRQGDILAGLAFAIATLAIFVAIKANHPDTLVLAIVDDLTLTGPPKSVLSAYKQLKDTLWRGMEVQPAKCFLLVPEGGLPEDDGSALAQEVHHLGLQVAQGCISLLGAVVGRDNHAKAAWLQNKLGAWAPTLKMAKLPPRVGPAELAFASLDERAPQLLVPLDGTNTDNACCRLLRPPAQGTSGKAGGPSVR
jgi:hypothetical protein